MPFYDLGSKEKYLMKKFLAALSLIFVGTACAFAAACTNKNTVKISFDVNGGTGISDVAANAGENVTLPEPVKEGYEFEGWYLTVDFFGSPVETVTATESTTYYAKWAKLYSITLDLDGGSLSQTSLSLKAGANVYDYMSQYVPVKRGLIFGAWFNGSTELEKNLRMPESGLNLTAKYKVEYSVEVYKRNVEDTKYVQDEEVIKSADYVGATVTPEQTFTGFKRVENSQAVASKTLTATASENVLKLYFDREEYTVNFISNYPDGTKNVTSSVQAKYGTEVNLPIDLTCEGYCLVGYSTTQDGEVEYGVNYINTVLYKKNGQSNLPQATFAPDKNTSLYAVWTKGYTDMFGGNDYVFLLDEQADVIYLARGNVFFEGVYRPLTKGFTIETGSDPIEGRLNADGTFAYATPSRTTKVYNRYVSSGVIDEDAKVLLDPYNGLTYTVTEDGNDVSSSGTYVIEDGMYMIHYTSGKLEGTDAVMILGSLASGSSVFILRNEEEVAMGVIPRIGVDYSGNVGTYSNGLLGIKLNGFGVAAINMGEQETSYNYTLSEDKAEINLTNSYGMSVGVARLMELEGFKGYMFYNKAFDLEIEQGNSSLKLDGVCRATYVNGNTVINGYYLNMGTNPMGGTMIRLIAEGTSYNILVSSKTNTITNDDGSTTKETIYSFAEKLATYAEYYYSDEGGVYYHTIALDDEQVGKATIYQRISNSEYVKVATGKYEYDKENDVYLFTKEEYFAVEGISTAVFDMSAIISFVFNTGEYTSSGMTGTTTYNVLYWLTSTTSEGTTDNTDVYTGENGSTLTFVASFAIYNDGKTAVSGMYSVKDGLVTINASTARYFKVNEEEKTFTALESAPSTAYEMLADGSYKRSSYIRFDGTAKGAVYTYVDGEQTVTLEGTFVSTDKTTDFGYFIYTFTSGETKFNFIRISTSSMNLFSKYNEEYNGEYESETEGVLSLDGYNYNASFANVDGNTYKGFYSIVSENTIRLDLTSSLRLYFDLGENKSFTLRGTEYGTYFVMDNNSIVGTLIELDGYGKAKVFTTKTENNETVPDYIDENATYSIANRLYTISYTDKGIKCMVGKLMVYSTGSNSFNVFVIIHDEVVQTYVNEKDFSTLILDNAGAAIKYDARGRREDGMYTLITENILSYVNNRGTDAYIYVYDTEKGTANTVSFTPVAYYADNLEALQFNRYGIATFNGSMRAYYSVDEVGNVTIYRLPEEGETGNAYGFVAENFGKFDNEKHYKENRYYKNNGYDLNFARVEETKNYYPVLVSSKEVDGKKVNNIAPLQDLLFTPSGAVEFSVSGKVTIVDGDDKTNDTYSCTVVRRIVDDKTETFVIIPLNFGYYRFDINLTFHGEDEYGQSKSTYEVIGMHRVIEMPSYNYLYAVYMYSMFDSMLGTNMAAGITNTLGTISIMYDYDEKGKIIDAEYDPETGDLAYVKDENGKDTDKYVNDGGYVKAEFGEDSGLFDANGNLLSISHGEISTEIQNRTTLYTVDFKGGDGKDYRLRFANEAVQQLGAYGYRLYGLTRVQTLDYGEYSVEVERIIGTDLSNMYRGGIMSVKLTKGGEELQMTSGIITEDGSVIFISRTFGEGDDKDKILSTIYYTISFKEVTSEIVGGEDDDKIVPVYESVTVEEQTITTIYTEDGNSYVDKTDSEIRLLCIDGRGRLVSECELDEATGVYTATVKTSATTYVKYTVEIKDGKAVITEIVEEAEEEQEAA